MNPVERRARNLVITILVCGVGILGVLASFSIKAMLVGVLFYLVFIALCCMTQMPTHDEIEEARRWEER